MATYSEKKQPLFDRNQLACTHNLFILGMKEDHLKDAVEDGLPLRLQLVDAELFLQQQLWNNIKLCDFDPDTAPIASWEDLRLLPLLGKLLEPRWICNAW